MSHTVTHTYWNLLMYVVGSKIWIKTQEKPKDKKMKYWRCEQHTHTHRDREIIIIIIK